MEKKDLLLMKKSLVFLGGEIKFVNCVALNIVLL